MSFLASFSVRRAIQTPKRTTTNILSCRFLCLDSHPNSQKDDHKYPFLPVSLSGLPSELPKGRPQISFLAGFSVWFAFRTPKRTTTNILSFRFLCLNYPPNSEIDNHNYRFFPVSLSGLPSELPKGQPQIPFLAGFSVRRAIRAQKR